MKLYIIILVLLSSFSIISALTAEDIFIDKSLEQIVTFDEITIRFNISNPTTKTFNLSKIINITNDKDFNITKNMVNGDLKFEEIIGNIKPLSNSSLIMKFKPEYKIIQDGENTIYKLNVDWQPFFIGYNYSKWAWVNSTYNRTNITFNLNFGLNWANSTMFIRPYCFKNNCSDIAFLFNETGDINNSNVNKSYSIYTHNEENRVFFAYDNGSIAYPIRVFNLSPVNFSLSNISKSVFLYYSDYSGSTIDTDLETKGTVTQSNGYLNATGAGGSWNITGAIINRSFNRPLILNMSIWCSTSNNDYIFGIKDNQASFDYAEYIYSFACVGSGGTGYLRVFEDGNNRGTLGFYQQIYTNYVIRVKPAGADYFMLNGTQQYLVYNSSYSTENNLRFGISPFPPAVPLSLNWAYMYYSPEIPLTNLSTLEIGIPPALVVNVLSPENITYTSSPNILLAITKFSGIQNITNVTGISNIGNFTLIQNGVNWTNISFFDNGSYNIYYRVGSTDGSYIITDTVFFSVNYTAPTPPLIPLYNITFAQIPISFSINNQTFNININIQRNVLFGEILLIFYLIMKIWFVGIEIPAYSKTVFNTLYILLDIEIYNRYWLGVIELFGLLLPVLIIIDSINYIIIYMERKRG